MRENRGEGGGRTLFMLRRRRGWLMLVDGAVYWTSLCVTTIRALSLAGRDSHFSQNRRRCQGLVHADSSGRQENCIMYECARDGHCELRVISILRC